MYDQPTPNERGAVLVEFSIVSLLILLIAASIVEYASVYSSTLDTSSAVRSGARSASIVGTDGAVTDDWHIIDSLVAKSGGRRSDFARVVIYRATPLTSQPPTACTTGGPVGAEKCNSYSTADLLLTQNQLQGLPPSKRNWPEAARVAGVDSIGIWVKVNRPRLFSGLVPAPASYSDRAAMPISPYTPPAQASSWQPGVVVDPGWKDDWFCWNGSCYDEGDGGGGAPIGGGGGGGT